MDSHGDNDSLLSKLITWFVIAVIGLVAIRLAFWLLGMAMGIFGTALGLGAYLLFKLGPVVLLGWLILKLVRSFRGRDEFEHA